MTVFVCMQLGRHVPTAATYTGVLMRGMWHGHIDSDMSAVWQHLLLVFTAAATRLLCAIFYWMLWHSSARTAYSPAPRHHWLPGAEQAAMATPRAAAASPNMLCASWVGSRVSRKGATSGARSGRCASWPTEGAAMRTISMI